MRDIWCRRMESSVSGKIKDMMFVLLEYGFCDRLCRMSDDAILWAVRIQHAGIATVMQLHGNGYDYGPLGNQKPEMPEGNEILAWYWLLEERFFWQSLRQSYAIEVFCQSTTLVLGLLQCRNGIFNLVTG